MFPCVQTLELTSKGFTLEQISKGFTLVTMESTLRNSTYGNTYKYLALETPLCLQHPKSATSIVATPFRPADLETD